MTGAMIVTACFGERYHAMLPAWCRMLRRVTDLPITVLALDGRTPTVPVRDVRIVPMPMPGKLGWGSNEVPRTTYILEQLAQGTTCVQVDMDIYLKAPIDPLLELPYDFVISRSFGVMPREMVLAHGFEACSGFYVAKPGAAPFLTAMLEGVARGRTVAERCDQWVMNMLLLDETWRHDVVAPAPLSGAYSTTQAFDARICVLDGRDIGRDYDVRSARFGNHAGHFCWLWEHDVLPESPRGRAYIGYHRVRYPWVMRKRRTERWAMRQPTVSRLRGRLLARAARCAPAGVDA